MPRSKRKREAGTTPPPPSRRRGSEREAETGAEPVVGRKNSEIDSEGAGVEPDTAAMDGTPKDPLESDQSNNPPDNNAEKEQGNGSAQNGTSGEGNDQAEPLQESATVAQHEQQEQGEDKETNTTEDTATTKTPVQAISKRENQTNSKSTGNSSDARIQAVLNHRKLLLSRLERGREAVQKRLDFAYKKNPAAKDQTDDQEIVAFQMLAKDATSLARKSKVDEAGEKRTSVSLRRGSSVGKKMNAALSSLAPGTASVAAAAAAAAVAAAVASAPEATVAATAHTPPPLPIPKPVPSTSLKKATSTATVPLPSASIPQAPPPITIAAPKKSSSTKSSSSKASSRVATSPRVTSAPGIPPPFSHTNLLGTPSRLAQPLANVPDCILLREKRRTIRNKIAALAPIESEQSTTSMQDKTKQSFDSLRRAKQSLPPRRKTHWDYLLEEMRWMATDFKQERNWKVSMCHTLSKDFKERSETLGGPQKQLEFPTSLGDAATPATTTTPPISSEDQVAMEVDSSETNLNESDGRSLARKISAMVLDFVKDFSSVPKVVEEITVSDEQGSRESENPGKSVLPDKPQLPAAGEREALYNLVDEIAATARTSTRIHRSSTCKVDGTQLQLSSDQGKALLLLEDKLSSSGSGALLEGSYACGKTVVTLALLSRTNGDGPHLIICPTESVIKWVDRAQYFEHIQIRSLASVLRDKPSLEENDVVLCDHAGLDQVHVSLSNAFKSIIVDCRHPWGYRGSRWASHTEDSTELQNIMADFYPNELSSLAWWTQLSRLGSDSCVRRLVVENKSTKKVAELFSGLSDKSKLDLLALRVSFLSSLHSKTDGDVSLPKLLIGWARKQVKGAKSQGSKFERVVCKIVDVLDSYSCCLPSTEIIEEVPDGFAFDVQKCDMTEVQRLTYEEKCSAYRRILSCAVDQIGGDSTLLEQTSSCLLDLRRSCMHADLEALLQNPLVRSTMHVLSDWGSRKLSSSQPNQELASRIMECSGKMSHLASFLSGESSVSLAKETQNLVWKKEGKRKSAKVKHAPMKNKVVILATLPEAQLLVSLFLHSLGIDHEFIPDEFGSELCSNYFQREQAYRWIRGQVRLTGFNHQNVDDPSATNVVVCSPMTVSGDHGGVGVDTADAVICIDEDWSGRGELLYNALLHRFWCASNKKCKFIKLVAADTCEEHFLASGEFGELEQKDLLWTASPLGVFKIKSTLKPSEISDLATMLKTRGKPESWFGFPGLNLYASTNETLSEVFSTSSPLKRKFGATGPLLLLPSDGDCEPSFVSIIAKILESESRCLSNELYGKSNALVHARLSLKRLEFGGAAQCFGDSFDRFNLDKGTDANQGVKLGIPSASSKNLDQPMDIETFEQEESAPTEKVRGSSLCYASPGGILADSKRRNAFASSYSTHTSQDSRLVGEALPYFPPLFPRMAQASILAQNRLAILQSASAKGRSNGRDSDSTAKRAREDPVAATQAAIFPEGSSKRDLAQDLLDLDDDYGLAGIGAVPLLRDSVLAAALEPTSALSRTNSNDADSMVLIVTRKRQRPGHLIMPPTTFTQRDGMLPPGSSLPSLQGSNLSNAVNLEVNSGKNAKKLAPLAGKLQPKPDDSMHLVRTQMQMVPQGVKMKEAIRGRFLATCRQSGIGTSIFESPSFRAAFVRIRHRLRNCTSRDCWHSRMIFDAGPGLPIHACRAETKAADQPNADRTFWTSLVKALPDNSTTGDEAVIAASAQKAALRRSLSAPCRVDFGPFQSGFLTAPSGMTAIVPPRPRGGVSLPMGVKVPSPTKALHVPWTGAEEKQLQACILRFGTNWMLAARTLSGVQDVETVSRQSPGVRPFARAGRSCREHWHVMVRNQPHLARDLRQTERLQREKATHRFGHKGPPQDQMVQFERRSLSETEGSSEYVSSKAFFTPSSQKENTVGSAMESKEPENPEVTNAEPNPASTARKRRSFSAIATAKAKKVQIPRTIPGVQSGSPPTISPSHPSHMQAIQKSATAKWSGGRTDMWPIQFLDAADRHRNPTVAPNPQQRIPGTSSSRSHVAPPGSRQPYPPAPPHRMVPTGPHAVRVPPASARPSSSVATKQSFAPPSSRARQSDEKKPTQK